MHSTRPVRTRGKLESYGLELGHYLGRSCPECGCADRISLYWFQDLRPEAETVADPNLTCHNCFHVFRESAGIRPAKNTGTKELPNGMLIVDEAATMTGEQWEHLQELDLERESERKPE